MKNFLKYTVSAAFGISAIAKLIDFENTATYFVSLVQIDFKIARYSLALAIFLELLFAYLIPINWRWTKIVHNATLVILFAFLAISVSMAFMGVKNCGCFGAFLTTNPLATILKNIFLLAMWCIVKFDARNLKHV